MNHDQNKNKNGNRKQIDRIDCVELLLLSRFANQKKQQLEISMILLK